MMMPLKKDEKGIKEHPKIEENTYIKPLSNENRMCFYSVLLNFFYLHFVKMLNGACNQQDAKYSKEKVVLGKV